MMNRVTVRVSAGGRSVSQDLDLVEEREYFDELKSNGANPGLTDVTFEQWLAPICTPDVLSLRELAEYNGNHFIYGHIESLMQSDSCPRFVREAERVKIEVLWS